MDFGVLTDQEIYELFTKMSEEEAMREASNLTPEQIASLVFNLVHTAPKNKNLVLLNLFLGADKKRKVEAIGRNLDGKSSIFLSEKALELDMNVHWKFISLLVGFSRSIFLNLLTAAPEKQIEMLKHDAMTEPMQHHLVMFIHEMEKEVEHLTEEVERFEKEIALLNPHEMTYANLNGYYRQFDEIREECELMEELINKSLKIAWNSNREDLIERLTTLKEASHKTLTLMIGHPGKYKEATGLYRLVEIELGKVYGDIRNKNDIEGLKNDEQGIEALAKLSLWYPKDFIEVGLLPENDFENKPEVYQEKVKEQLRTINLGTVEQFKQAHIYSKAMLREYIQSLPVKR